MIRMNFLQSRLTSPAETPVSDVDAGPGELSPKRSFISIREVVLGVVLLGIAAAILHSQYGLFTSEGTDTGQSQPVAEPAQQTPGSEETAAAAPASGEPAGGTASEQSEPTASTAAGRAPAADDRPSPTRRAAAPAPARPSGPTLRVSSVTMSLDSGSLRIFVAADGRPDYNMFQLNNPNRVVIDIPNARLLAPRRQREQNVNRAEIERLRVAQNQNDPPKVRIVLDVGAFPNLLIFPHAGGLDIQVHGAGQ